VNGNEFIGALDVVTSILKYEIMSQISSISTYSTILR